MTNNFSSIQAQQRGMGIVELMIGIVIALLGTLVVMQTFAVSEGYKRTTVSGNEAQQSGAVALYTVERDVRQAGFGLGALLTLNCKIQGYDETGAMTFPLTPDQWGPASIVNGAGAAPDQIRLNYASGDAIPFAAKLSSDYGGAAANIKVNNRYGFKEGDVVLVVDPTNLATDCSLMQVTGVPGTPGGTDNIIHNSGMYTDAFGKKVPARFNPPGGLGIPYPSGSTVLNLGALPEGKTYSVANNSLWVADTFQPGAQSFADNIVNLQAQYGRDTDGDGRIDIWDENTVAAQADWTRVLALRVAIVARSTIREKEIVTPGNSLTLWTNPVGSAAAPTHTLAGDDNYFRYKVYETIIPLRSIIWRE